MIEVIVRPLPEDDPWPMWFARLAEFAHLEEGWNSYTAPAPNEVSIQTAGVFLKVMQAAGREPTRLAPSAMGGVAVTRRQGNRKVFVEFYNDGRVYALFAQRPDDMRVVPVTSDEASFQGLASEMGDYLHD